MLSVCKSSVTGPESNSINRRGLRFHLVDFELCASEVSDAARRLNRGIHFPSCEAAGTGSRFNCTRQASVLPEGLPP